MLNCHTDKVSLLIDINGDVFTDLLCLLHLAISELNMSRVGI